MLGAPDVLGVLGGLVAGVQEFCLGEKFLLDEAGAGEAEDGVGGAGFVVCAGGAGAAEGLLADEGGGCFAV